MSVASYQIKGRPAVRTVAGAALLSLLGIGVMLAAGAFNWGSVALTVGVVIAIGGIGVLLLAQEAARKAGVIAMLDNDGFVLTSAQTRFGLPWAEVRKVTMAGNQLTIRDAHGKDASIVAPPGARPEELDRLAAAMAAKLDANRGYRNLN